MNLSEHFTLDEMTISQEAVRSGLRNEPSDVQIESLRALCEAVLEPLRARIKRPIVVLSGFRSVTINRRVGGVDDSQHCKGEAGDIMVPGMDTSDVVDMIRAMKLPIDQVIDEFARWVHVSHSRRRGNRGEVLMAWRRGGQTHYRRVT
ncbi:D-Ala-D-Ala carboxypeptidase family metallohydrolase [Thiobacillus denitrificans]|uniref:Peptidase M15A C-terminal domain-containing protein n=1 Tax=Thiobacillus denitrificans TaxID=36861 RepID=A0A106BVP5_THIDE|nr:D-Ala-D-Ala carboxypeptidase family metallohydrolase [Thiobacillus denitrificans]KVW99505.1 hypothetical protein ABW22_01415 [Thiobacillus denitrificans]